MYSNAKHSSAVPPWLGVANSEAGSSLPSLGSLSNSPFAHSLPRPRRVLVHNCRSIAGYRSSLQLRWPQTSVRTSHQGACPRRVFVHNSRLTIHYLQLTIHYLRFTIYYSRLTIHKLPQLTNFLHILHIFCTCIDVQNRLYYTHLNGGAEHGYNNNQFYRTDGPRDQA